MKTVYCCTYIEKRISEDDYEQGCSTESNCVLCERVHLEGRDITELLKAIGDEYGLTMDDLFIESGDGSGPVSTIGFNRTEDREGNVPTPKQVREWQENGSGLYGESSLFIADYTFAVEKRMIEPINVEEFTIAGITTH